MNRMKPALALAGKELKAYFSTPVAYIVITIFLVFTGFFFFKDYFYFQQAEMRNFFQLLPLFLSFVVPAVTMRLIAEERHTGSLEIILTLPLSTMDVVLGKFIAGLAFTGVMLAPTLIYLVTVIITGSPDPGPIIGGYLGTLLLAGAYTGIGVLASSLTRNQIVAFITSWAVCFSLWLVDKMVIFLPSGLSFLEQLGTDYHFQNIARGVIDTRDIIYFVSVIAVSILLTERVLEKRR